MQAKNGDYMAWDKEQIHQFEREIDWLKNELATKRLTPKMRQEYRRQIRKKELEIVFNGTPLASA